MFFCRKPVPISAADSLIILFNTPAAIPHLFWCEQFEPVPKSSPSEPGDGESQVIFGSHGGRSFLIDRQAYLRNRFDRVVAASRRARAHIWIGGYSSVGDWSLFLVAIEGAVRRYLWWDKQRTPCPCDGGDRRIPSEDHVALSAEGGAGINEALKAGWPDVEKALQKGKRELVRIRAPSGSEVFPESTFFDPKLPRLEQRVRRRDLRIEKAWAEF